MIEFALILLTTFSFTSQACSNDSSSEASKPEDIAIHNLIKTERLNEYARQDPLGFLAHICAQLSEDIIVKQAEKILAGPEEILAEHYADAIQHAKAHAKTQEAVACAQLMHYLKSHQPDFMAKKAIQIAKEYKKNMGE